MKKVEHGKIKIRLKGRDIHLPGRTINLANHDWLFTDEEKNEIRFVLKGRASKEKIETFIDHLEHLCAIKKELIGQPPKINLRDMHERVLKDFKAVLRHLKKIERGETILWRENTVSHYGEVEPAESHSHLFLWDAIPPIEEYIKVLEENPEEAKMFKQAADTDRFESEIANALIKDMGLDPSSDINNAFSTVVKKVREMLGVPGSTDPSKTIKAVLKKIKLGHSS
jgi:hypothetical protein